MTDEGMGLLAEWLEEYGGSTSGRNRKPCTPELEERTRAYLSHREPQGETPETDAADDPTMRFSARHERLKDLCKFLERRLREAESKIDALMLEYCPSDMTQEQMDRWGRHQNPVIEAAERGKEK